MNTLLNRGWISLSNRWRALREAGAERGLTTTEVAVLTFILVGLAIAVGAFIVNYTSDTVNAIEEAPRPEIGID